MYTGDYENQLLMVMSLSEKFQMEKEQEFRVVEGQGKVQGRRENVSTKGCSVHRVVHRYALLLSSREMVITWFQDHGICNSKKKINLYSVAHPNSQNNY